MAKTWFRACERRAVHLPARLNGLQPESAQVTLVDLGLTGCCVMLSASVPVGEGLMLELQPPNLWDPLRVPCEVIWCEPRAEAFYAGLQFELQEASLMGLLVDLMTAGNYD